MQIFCSLSRHNPIVVAGGVRFWWFVENIGEILTFVLALCADFLRIWVAAEIEKGSGDNSRRFFYVSKKDDSFS